MSRTITNHAGLPDAIVDSVVNDGYTKGTADISVTSLIKPVRIVALERKYEDQISEDASDRIFSLLGQAVHTILERANKKHIAERRLSIKLEGWKISGGMDVYQDDGVLIDYKVTSVYKITSGDYSDWTHQLNCYSAILQHNKEKVTKLQVIAILRDWSRREANRSLNYPKAQVVVIDIPLWAFSDSIKYMTERVILHKKSRISLPLCTPQERWAHPDTYALMKKGRKRAIKLLYCKEDAEKLADEDKSLSVVHRPGASIRCESYCSVKPFCSQAAAYNTIKKEIDDEE